MATILPPEGGLGQSVGAGLGSGLSSLLQGLSSGQNKQALAQQFKQQGLPEFLAHVDPQVQAHYLRNAQAAQAAQIEAQKQDADAQLQKVLGNLQQPPTDLQQPDGAPSPLANARVPGVAATKNPDMPVKQVQNIESADNITPRSVSQEARLKKDIEDLQAVVDDQNTPARVRAKAEERLEGKSKRFDKLSEQLFNATKETRDEVTKNLQDNTELRATLEMQKELNEKGELDTPGYLTGLKNAGFDIDALKTNDTLAFIKANGIHFKNLKKLFGARPTQKELELYMSTIANEYQSPEGRRRIIDMMLIGADASDIRGQAMEDIIQDNGGLPPRDLGAKIERRSRDDIKDEYKKFKEIVNRTPFEGQNKLITLAQAAAGKAVPILGGATLGAGLGSLFGGPIGSAGGALLGGAAPGAIDSIKDILRGLGR